MDVYHASNHDSNTAGRVFTSKPAVNKEEPGFKRDTLLLLKLIHLTFYWSPIGLEWFGYQTAVANQMAKTAEKADPEFIISCGDNFQVNGVRSVNDPLWMTTFESVYKSPSLLIDWYPVLGTMTTKGTRMLK